MTLKFFFSWFFKHRTDTQQVDHVAIDQTLQLLLLLFFVVFLLCWLFFTTLLCRLDLLIELILIFLLAINGGLN